MVQPELHPQDEGFEGDGNPRQPVADTPPSGVPEAVTAVPAPADPVASETAYSSRAPEVPPPPVGYAERPREEDQGSLFETDFRRFDAAPAPVPFERVEGPAQVQLVPAVADGHHGPAMRIEIDDRSAIFMRRLELWRDEFIAWVKTLASAAVYATLIVTFGFQVARVEGQSMAPTLSDQDRLIVNKLAYRLADPQRGDIVMLYYPLNPDKSFVKRVIAEENDTVRVVDGRVYVNDVPLRDDYVPPEYRSHDDWGPQVIPEGYYFVMGDHRNNSSDSRHWGFVPKRYIIGKVQLRWWPVPNGRVF